MRRRHKVQRERRLRMGMGMGAGAPQAILSTHMLTGAEERALVASLAFEPEDAWVREKKKKKKKKMCAR